MNQTTIYKLDLYQGWGKLYCFTFCYSHIWNLLRAFWRWFHNPKPPFGCSRRIPASPSACSFTKSLVVRLFRLPPPLRGSAKVCKPTFDRWPTNTEQPGSGRLFDYQPFLGVDFPTLWEDLIPRKQHSNYILYVRPCKTRICTFFTSFLNMKDFPTSTSGQLMIQTVRISKQQTNRSWTLGFLLPQTQSSIIPKKQKNNNFMLDTWSSVGRRADHMTDLTHWKIVSFLGRNGKAWEAGTHGAVRWCDSLLHWNHLPKWWVTKRVISQNQITWSPKDQTPWYDPHTRAKTTPIKAAWCLKQHLMAINICESLSTADSHPCHPRTRVNLPTQDGICEGGTYLDARWENPWPRSCGLTLPFGTPLKLSKFKEHLAMLGVKSNKKN